MSRCCPKSLYLKKLLPHSHNNTLPDLYKDYFVCLVNKQWKTVGSVTDFGINVLFSLGYLVH